MNLQKNRRSYYSFANFKSKLDALVASGTITQSQAVSILNTFSGWGSSWKIPAPSKDSHNNKKILDKTNNTTSSSNVAGQNNVH